MTKEIKEIIVAIIRCTIIAFAIYGIAIVIKGNIVKYNDIKLVAVNGNTNSEYIIEINDVQYYKQNEFNYYFAQNQDLSK